MGDALSGEVAQVEQAPRRSANYIKAIRRIVRGMACRDVLVRTEQAHTAAAGPEHRIESANFIPSDHIDHRLVEGQIDQRIEFFGARACRRLSRIGKLAQLEQRPNKRTSEVRILACQGLAANSADQLTISADHKKDANRGTIEAAAKLRRETKPGLMSKVGRGVREI